jgi:U3-containing 90S pre-ribosomal complex subunit
MGDTLDENFALSDGDYQSEIETKVTPVIKQSKKAKLPATVEAVKPKKRNWREAVASGFADANAQCLLVREAVNYKGGHSFTAIEFDDMGITTASFLSLTEDCSKEPGSLEDSIPAVSQILEESNGVKGPSVLILTPSTHRCADFSLALGSLKPTTLQLHGSGRKQEQFAKMKKDLAAATLVVSVPSRVHRFCEEQSFSLTSLKMVIIDMQVDAKGLNALSMNETREQIARFITGHLFTRLKSGDCKVVLF